MTNHNRLKIVIFDLCGTLLNSKALDHQAINYTLKKFQQPPWYITRTKKDKSLSMKENFPNFFGKNAKKAYSTYINYLIEHINNISFFEHASEHLQMLKQFNIKTAIITNRDNLFIDALKEQNEYKQQFQPFIDTIITADEAEICKPSPIIIELAINKLNIQINHPQQIAFVGDAYADIKCAIDFGCQPILLNATPTDLTTNFLSLHKNQINQFTSHREIIENYLKTTPNHLIKINNILKNTNLIKTK